MQKYTVYLILHLVYKGPVSQTGLRLSQD